LGIHTGNFLNGGDVPLSTFLDDCSDLSLHGYSL
jgi:hypothetical protein